MAAASENVVLDGRSLEIAELVRIARDSAVRVSCDAAALQAVERGRRQIEEIVARHHKTSAGGSPAAGVYGITTGFGEFKSEAVDSAAFEQLQRNLLLSHSVGVGDTVDADDPANYFPAEVVRAVLALRINAFLKGHSGVRVELIDVLTRMLNAGVVPLVPTRGSLGSSGDLCPLCHLFSVLLGVGRYYVAKNRDELATTFAGRVLRDAKQLAADLGVASVPLPSFKEGLALSNGATFTAALLALAVYDAENLALQADINAALALEAMCGRARALDPKIHAARGMTGQIESAARIRGLISGSKLVDQSAEVQDAYSLRCAPQVHGASRDAISYARNIVETELNAATDNPLFFPDAGEPWDVAAFGANRGGRPTDVDAYSGGNFHGQPLGLAADFLAIAVAELANISERRTQMLLDRHHNRNLPANLVADRGLNSGLMIAQYTAASLVSENKTLAHPASVDSIPSSANTEDHNAMSTIAARKLRTVVGNVEAALAIEALVTAQAIEWRAGLEIDPNRPRTLLADEESKRFAECATPQRRDVIAASLGDGTRAAYLAIRVAAPTVVVDRPLDGDIRAVRRAVRGGAIAAAVAESAGRDSRS